MRTALVCLFFSLAACGGGSSSHDAGPDSSTTSCPQSIHDVDDGQPCGSVSLTCNPCSGCGACEELLCESGQWVHMLVPSTCEDGGT